MTANQNNLNVSLQRLQQELNRFFMNDKGMLEDWLSMALPRIGGESPRSLLDSELGRKTLLEVLNEMKHGEMS